MDKTNKVLKIVFLCLLVAFIGNLVILPKTNCQACEIEHEGKIIDGYEAFEIFKEKCLIPRNAWDNDPETPTLSNNNSIEKEYFYVDLDDINISYDENGTQIIEFPEEYLDG